MNRLIAGAPLAALALASAFPAGTARASTYTFTRIADNAGPLATLANPAINSNGDVVFRASLDAGGTQVIFVGNGGALTQIADNTAASPYLGFGDPVINGSGVVAFSAGRRAGGSGVFAVSGATTETVALTTGAGGTFTSFNSSSLAINSSGVVSFSGATASAVGVYAGPAGGIAGTISDSTGALASYGSLTTINDGGTVAFIGNLDAGGAGVFTGNGGGLTTIADSSGPLNTSINGPSINASGLVAFTAGLDSGGAGLFAGNGGGLTTVATTAGPFGSFSTNAGFGPSLNGSGNIITRATPDVGNDGFFDGVDPSLNGIIAIGQALDGSTVSTMSALSGRMNDAGQFVFAVSLNDGRSGIYRAEPVPEPIALGGIGLLACSLRRGRRPSSK
jgi:hypothetical protein